MAWLKPHLFIFFSLLLALMLRLLPAPQWGIWLRPEWVGLVCVFWAVNPPYRIGVGSAWLIGLFIDVMSGTLLGEHALSFAVICYVAQLSYVQLSLSPWWQQSIIIFGLVLLNQILLFLIQGMVGVIGPVTLFWLPALSSMLFWPWLSLFLQTYFE